MPTIQQLLSVFNLITGLGWSFLEKMSPILCRLVWNITKSSYPSCRLNMELNCTYREFLGTLRSFLMSAQLMELTSAFKRCSGDFKTRDRLMWNFRLWLLVGRKSLSIIALPASWSSISLAKLTANFNSIFVCLPSSKRGSKFLKDQ